MDLITIFAHILLQYYLLKKWIVIFGALNTRPPEAFFAQLKSVAISIHTLEISGQPAALPARELATAATSVNIPARPANSLVEALAYIKRTATPNTPVIICGSLYLAGQVLEENQTPPD